MIEKVSETSKTYSKHVNDLAISDWLIGLCLMIKMLKDFGIDYSEFLDNKLNDTSLATDSASNVASNALNLFS